MAKDVQSEFQILEILRKQGFSEEIINTAMKRTNSKSIEDVIDYIEQLQKSREKDPEFALKEKALDEEVKRRREETIKNKIYLEQIREQIRADRMERENAQKQPKDSGIVKSEEITNFGECTIKVRTGGKIVILHFKKNDTTSELLKRVASALNIKKFKLYLVNPPSEIVESSVTLEEIGLTPTGVVLIGS